MSSASSNAHIRVDGLTMAYGSFVIMRDLTFEVARGSVFVIMGGSGCGKSTLLRHLIGLNAPTAGTIFYGEENFSSAPPDARERMLRRFGVLYQAGALFSSLTLAQNVMLPLGEYTDLAPRELRESLGATIVVVTHELPSIFTIADDSVFLDADSRTMIASGAPKELLARSTDPRVREFLTRGAEGSHHG